MKRFASLLLVCALLCCTPCAFADPDVIYWPLEAYPGATFNSRTLTNPAGHNGVDLIADEGTPLIAAGSGTAYYFINTKAVDGATCYVNYGWHIRLDFDAGGHALYAHLSAFPDAVEPFVPAGLRGLASYGGGGDVVGQATRHGIARMRVNAGDVIGYMGSTGNSDTPHLHYELYLEDGLAWPRDEAYTTPYPRGQAAKGDVSVRLTQTVYMDDFPVITLPDATVGQTLNTALRQYADYIWDSRGRHGGEDPLSDEPVPSTMRLLEVYRIGDVLGVRFCVNVVGWQEEQYEYAIMLSLRSGEPMRIADFFVDRTAGFDLIRERIIAQYGSGSSAQVPGSALEEAIHSTTHSYAFTASGLSVYPDAAYLYDGDYQITRIPLADMLHYLDWTGAAALLGAHDGQRLTDGMSLYYPIARVLTAP